MTRHLRFALSAFTVIALSAAVLAESHVRIVRLSSVEGKVQMDRAGEGLERAILNTPVVEGTRLLTGSDGLAEVEFENQSALRLTEDSEVKFKQLLMNDAGAKVNQIEVIKGLVYLDAASKGDDIYRVNVGANSLLVRRDSLVRLDATAGQIQVAVFKGEAQLENQPQPVSVRKNETLTLDAKAAPGYTIAKGVEAVRFDNWNKERQDYSKTYAQNQGYGGPNRGYGLQDLNYYGDFFYANGYGYVWQPFGFAGVMSSWDPYSNGAWMSYPGMGYMWASSYPWGWLPYHYGSWTFINGAGWAWVPGRYNNQWTASNFQNVPKITKAPQGWTAAAPPSSMTSSSPTVLVGKAATSQAAVPGGRVPPAFGSVIPGRHVGTSAATKGFASPNTGKMTANRSVFASPQQGLAAAHHGATPAHVFAAPTVHDSFAEPEAVSTRGAHAGGMRAPVSPAAHSSAGAIGGSAAHGSAGASAGHK